MEHSHTHTHVPDTHSLQVLFIHSFALSARLFSAFISIFHLWLAGTRVLINVKFTALSSTDLCRRYTLCTRWFEKPVGSPLPPFATPTTAPIWQHLSEPCQGRDFLLLLPSYAGERSSLALRISLTRLTRLTRLTHSWHWPRSTVTPPTVPHVLTQHTGEKQQNCVAEHLQQFHLWISGFAIEYLGNIWE